MSFRPNLTFPLSQSSIFLSLQWHNLPLLFFLSLVALLISSTAPSSVAIKWESSQRLSPGTLLFLLCVLPGPSQLCQPFTKVYMPCLDLPGASFCVPTWHILRGIPPTALVPFSVFPVTACGSTSTLACGPES